eukprot:TRINITY_DN4006_c0_g1_i1.p1 TRINITY_DN4006_c0_g1~~TRINITY_DN4006_c0_g1_i1.p1  ORF type:complete len:855 (-),score=102.34 TRINITY_DN4006_c0_g1_i1:22-2586(-)
MDLAVEDQDEQWHLLAHDHHSIQQQQQQQQQQHQQSQHVRAQRTYWQRWLHGMSDHWGSVLSSSRGKGKGRRDDGRYVFEDEEAERMAREQLGNLCILPPEVMQIILRCCAARDLRVLGAVNSTFHAFGTDNTLWRDLYTRDFGFPHRLAQVQLEREIDWYSLYGLKMTHKLNPQRILLAPKPRNDFIQFVSVVFLLLLHILLLPIVVPLLLVVLLTFTPHAVLLWYRMARRWRHAARVLSQNSDETGGGVAFKATRVSRAFAAFNRAHMYAMCLYYETLTQAGEIAFDALGFMCLSTVGWLLCVVTIYRLPFIKDEIATAVAKTPDSGSTDREIAYHISIRMDALATPLLQGIFVLYDMLMLPLLSLPLILTVYRLPTVWRRLRGISVATHVSSSDGWRNVLWEECKLIGRSTAPKPATTIKRQASPSTAVNSDRTKRSLYRTSEAKDAESYEYSKIEEGEPIAASEGEVDGTASMEDISPLCASLYQLMLLMFFVVFSIPAFLIILATLSHRSIVLIKGFVNVGFDLEALCKLSVGESLDFLLDLCVLGLPFISFYLNILSIYRAPAIVIELWQLPYGTTAGMQASVICYTHLGYLFTDILAVCVLVPVLIITVYRVPATCRRLATHNYMTLMSGNIFRLMLAEVRQIALYAYVAAVAAVVFEFALGVLAAVSFVVVIVSLSHHLVTLYYALKANGPLTYHVLRDILIGIAKNFMYDLCVLCLPFMGWYFLLVTIYRVPVAVRKFQATYTFTVNALPANGPQALVVLFGQVYWVALDLVATCLFVPLLLVTVHRFPGTVRRLYGAGYWELFSENQFWAILWDEVSKIGYSDLSEHAKVLVGIVTDEEQPLVK